MRGEWVWDRARERGIKAFKAEKAASALPSKPSTWEKKRERLLSDYRFAPSPASPSPLLTISPPLP